MKKLTIGKGQRPGIRLNANGIVTRKSIMQTAGQLFSEFGYAGTSFRDITRESEIGLGSLVYHFGVKENLFLATVSTFFPTRERFEEIADPLENCGPESSKEAIVEAVSSMVSAFLKEMHCNRRASFLAKFYARLMLDSTPEATQVVVGARRHRKPIVEVAGAVKDGLHLALDEVTALDDGVYGLEEVRAVELKRAAHEELALADRSLLAPIDEVAAGRDGQRLRVGRNTRGEIRPDHAPQLALQRVGVGVGVRRVEDDDQLAVVGVEHPAAVQERREGHLREGVGEARDLQDVVCRQALDHRPDDQSVRLNHEILLSARFLSSF